MKFCDEHETALRLAFFAHGLSAGHRLYERALKDARLLVQAQAGAVSRVKMVQALKAADGTRAGCLICVIAAPDFVALAAHDVVTFYRSRGLLHGIVPRPAAKDPPEDGDLSGA